MARFLPGESADDALGAARRLADSGISTLLSQLGENIEKRAEAEAVVRQYRDVLVANSRWQVCPPISP